MTGRIQRLPVPAGHDGSYALGGNDRGDVVVGAYHDNHGDAVRWSRRGFNVLETLGGPSASANIIDRHRVTAIGANGWLRRPATARLLTRVARRIAPQAPASLLLPGETSSRAAQS